MGLNKKAATLEVGNLAFNASVQELGESLDQIDKITILKVQGRSKYGFIEI
jgi:hypothetical protein